MPDLDELRARRLQLRIKRARHGLTPPERAEWRDIVRQIKRIVMACDPVDAWDHPRPAYAEDGPRCRHCRNAPRPCGPCWQAAEPRGPMHPLERIGDDECGGKR